MGFWRQLFNKKKDDLYSSGLSAIIVIGTFALVFILSDLKTFSVLFFCSFICILFGSISIILFYQIWKQKKTKIKILFLILEFVSITFIFAAIYYFYYNDNSNNYSVSSSIQNGKLINDYNAEFDNLKLKNRKMLLLSELENNIDTILFAIKNFKGEEEGQHYKLKFGYYFYFSKVTVYAAPAGSSITYSICFVDTIDNKIKITDNEFSSISGLISPIIAELFELNTKEDVLKSINKILENLKKQQTKLYNDLNKTVSLNASMKFVDFYYFSAITMTTTGYGDITPNSSNVRIIVIIQTIFSVLFIAFSLTLLNAKQEE